MSDLNEKLIVVLQGKDESLSSTLKSAEKSTEKLTKSVENVAKADVSKVGSNLLEKLKAVGADTSLGKMASEVGAGSSALEAIAGPAAIAAGAIAAVATAATSVGVKLFDMASDASEFGSKLYDMQQQTGLSAETLSALDLAATQSGTSLEAVGSSTSKFSKLIADAAGGSKDAEAKLKALGVTSNDLETALGQAYKTINKLKPGFDQNTASSDAFGKSLGRELLPFIKGMNGDLAGTIKNARELAVVMTEEDLRAADEFGDTLDLLKYQAKVTGAQFALQFAPEITGAMNDVSKVVIDNQDVIRAWGQDVGDVLRGVKAVAKETASFFKTDFGGYISTGISTIIGSIPGINNIEQLYSVLKFYGRATRPPNYKNVPIYGSRKDLQTREMYEAGVYDGDYLKNRNAAAKSGSSAGESFDKEFRAFAEDNDFRVSRTFGKNLQAKKGGSLHPYGLAGDLGIQGKSIQQIVDVLAAGIQKGWRALDERFKGALAGVDTKGPNAHFEKNPRRASMFMDNRPDLYGGQANLDYLKKLDADRLNKRTSKDEVAAFTEAQKKAAEARNKNWNAFVDKMSEPFDRESAQVRKSYEERSAEMATAIDRNLAVQQSGIDKAAAGLEREELFFKEGTKSYTANIVANVEARNQLLEESIQNEIDANNKLLANINGNEDQKADLESKGVILKLKLDTQKINSENAVTRAIRQQTDAIKQKAAEEASYYSRKRWAEGTRPRKVPNAEVTGDGKTNFSRDFGGTFGKSLFGEGVTGKVTSEAEALKAVYQDLGATAGNAMLGMIGAGEQLLESWILTGEATGAAVAQMTASIIAGLVTQAGIKAIFETAEGFAAAARYDVKSAAAHFAAAKTYGIVALSALGTGLVIGAAGGLQGKDSKSSSSGGDSQSYGTSNFGADSADSKTNYSRESSENFFNPDRRNKMLEQRIGELSESVNKLAKLSDIVESSKPGDVLVRGSNQKPGFISDQAITELSKNSTKTGKMNRILGNT